jgi:hypothetical protein
MNTLKYIPLVAPLLNVYCLSFATMFAQMASDMSYFFETTCLFPTLSPKRKTLDNILDTHYLSSNGKNQKAVRQ